MSHISEYAAHELPCLRIVRQQLERRPFVELPDFVRLHNMPAADLVALEKVIDGRDRTAGTTWRLHALARAVDLAITATFRMRLEMQLVDQRAGLQLRSGCLDHVVTGSSCLPDSGLYRDDRPSARNAPVLPLWRVITIPQPRKSAPGVFL